MYRVSSKQVPGRQRAVRVGPRVKAVELLSEDDDLKPVPYEVGVARWRAAVVARYTQGRPAGGGAGRGA